MAEGIVMAFSIMLFYELIEFAEVAKALMELFNAAYSLSELGQVVHVLELHDVDGRGDTESIKALAATVK